MSFNIKSKIIINALQFTVTNIIIYIYLEHTSQSM